MSSLLKVAHTKSNILGVLPSSVQPATLSFNCTFNVTYCLKNGVLVNLFLPFFDLSKNTWGPQASSSRIMCPPLRDEVGQPWSKASLLNPFSAPTQFPSNDKTGLT
jgi:hypothetical protein